MPIVSILEKGEGSPNVTEESSSTKNNKPKKAVEKRCYFGLLSLRSGIIVNTAIGLALLTISGLTVSREDHTSKETELSSFRRSFDFFIPIPFTQERGITVLNLYSSLTPFVALVGAYKKSPKLINLYKRIQYIDLAWSIGCFSWHGRDLFRAMADGLQKFASTDPSLPDDHNMTPYLWKYFGVFAAVIVVELAVFEIYPIYVTSKYGKALLAEEKQAATAKEAEEKKVGNF